VRRASNRSRNARLPDMRAPAGRCRVEKRRNQHRNRPLDLPCNEAPWALVAKAEATLEAEEAVAVNMKVGSIHQVLKGRKEVRC